MRALAFLTAVILALAGIRWDHTPFFVAALAAAVAALLMRRRA